MCLHAPAAYALQHADLEPHDLEQQLVRLKKALHSLQPQQQQQDQQQGMRPCGVDWATATQQLACLLVEFNECTCGVTVR